MTKTPRRWIVASLTYRRGAGQQRAPALAAQGLDAPTTTIAKEARVSNGSLFTYFDTKADLLNQLYLELKTDMGAAALGGLPAGGDARELMLHMWSGWLRWAAAYPDKRRALAQLEVSDEITASTHQAASQGLTGIAGILEHSRENGPMRDAPLAFVVALASALADTTIDSADPGERRWHPSSPARKPPARP